MLGLLTWMSQTLINHPVGFTANEAAVRAEVRGHLVGLSTRLPRAIGRVVLERSQLASLRFNHKPVTHVAGYAMERTTISAFKMH